MIPLWLFLAVVGLLSAWVVILAFGLYLALISMR